MIIKETDEGNAVVSMDTDYYKDIVLCILKNDAQYVKATVIVCYSQLKIVKNTSHIYKLISRRTRRRRIQLYHQFKMMETSMAYKKEKYGEINEAFEGATYVPSPNDPK